MNKCANCQMRRSRLHKCAVCGDQYIETCPNCGDDEFDIFIVDQMAETIPTS